MQPERCVPAVPAVRNLDHEVRIERGVFIDAVARIAPRVAHDARSVQDVVEAVVGVAVDPQLGAAAVQQVLRIRDETGVEQRPLEARVDARPRGGVVGDDHRRAVMRPGELTASHAAWRWNRDAESWGVNGRRGVARADAAVVAHEPRAASIAAVARSPSPNSMKSVHSVEPRKRTLPMSCASSSSTRTAGACAQTLELRRRALDAAAVELVVAGHIEHRLARREAHAIASGGRAMSPARTTTSASLWAAIPRPGQGAGRTGCAVSWSSQV